MKFPPLKMNLDFDAQTATDPKRDFPTRPPMKLDFQMLHVWKFSSIY